MTENSTTTAYSEKVPSTHSPPKSSPFWWKRNVPSGNSPVEAFLPSSHRFCRPVEQYRHLPQAGMNEQTTWSPTATRVTPSPTASTMPAPSCPPTTGNRICASPFWMWSSEWHSPAAMNLIRTSLARGSSSSSSVISHGRPGSRQIAARVVMLTWTPLPAVDVGREGTGRPDDHALAAVPGAMSPAPPTMVVRRWRGPQGFPAHGRRPPTAPTGGIAPRLFPGPGSEASRLSGNRPILAARWRTAAAVVLGGGGHPPTGRPRRPPRAGNPPARLRKDLA